MIYPKDGIKPIPPEDASDAPERAGPREGDAPRAGEATGVHATRATSGDLAGQFPPGARIAEHELLDVLGSRSDTAAFTARHGRRTVTLKLFDQAGAMRQEAARRLQAVDGPASRHPALARVDACGEHEGLGYYVRPFLRGDSIATILRSFEDGGSRRAQLSPLGPNEDGDVGAEFRRTAVSLFAEVASGLQAAHEEGLFHGRVHPGNLILSPAGRLVLTDFSGEAIEAAPQPPSFQEALYLAPEQLGAEADGEPRPADAQTDLYGLAAVLLHVLLRRTPRRLLAQLDTYFEVEATDLPGHTGADSDASGDDDDGDEAALSADLRAVLDRALAASRDERYGTAGELAEDLRRLLVLQAPRARLEATGRKSLAAAGALATDASEEHGEEEPAGVATGESDTEVDGGGEEASRSSRDVEDTADTDLEPAEEEPRGEDDWRKDSAGVEPGGASSAGEDPGEEGGGVATATATDTATDEAPTGEGEATDDRDDADVDADVDGDADVHDGRDDDRGTAASSDGGAAVDRESEAPGSGATRAGAPPRFRPQGGAARGGVDPALGSRSGDERSTPGSTPGSNEPLQARHVEVEPAVPPSAIELPSRAPRRVVRADEGVHTEAERELLFDPAPGGAVVSQRLDRRAGLFAVASFLTLVTIFTLFLLLLHDRSEGYKLDALQLGRGVSHLRGALLALFEDDDRSAARELSAAAAELGESDRDVARILDSQALGDLERLEARLHRRAADPVLARLADPDAQRRSAAVRRLAHEVAGGVREAAALEHVAPLVTDADRRVRDAAFDALVDGERLDLLLPAYPIGDEASRVDLSAARFARLHALLAREAIDGDVTAQRTFERVGLHGLLRLDEALRSADWPAGTPAVVVPPNLLVDADDAAAVAPGFVGRWLAVNAAVAPGRVFEALPLLGRQARLGPDLYAALEAIGTERAARHLESLTRERIGRCGLGGLEALHRLGHARALARTAYDNLPLPLRIEAVSLAVATHAEEGFETLGDLIRFHPEPRIRRAALPVLAVPGFAAAQPAALKSALTDLYLREEAIGQLSQTLPESAVAPLVELLRSGDVTLRTRVVELLGRSRHPDALLPLARQLRETSPPLRAATLQALAAHGDDRALPLAVGLLGPQHDGVEELARRLLPSQGKLREDLDVLVVALQELLQLRSPDASAYGLGGLRRDLLLERLDVDLAHFDARVPARVRTHLEQE